MWPVLVVVVAVDAEHMLEVAAAEDEDAVEAVGADGADPALGVGVRVRRLDGRADHLDALAPEDLVEGVAELRVAVVDEKSESRGQVLWAFGFAGLGISCGAREVTPYLSWKGCTLTILGSRQLVATYGNGFRLSEPFPGASHLPPVATGCDRSA